MAEIDELETVEENDDAPYVEFDISVSPSDYSLELIANRVVSGDIIIPFYQRRFVWKLEQASKLIESFLMGLPVPQVFLYENDENQLEVIDGQQRIMSIKYFFEGLFGEEDRQGRRQVFKLTGLSERSEYNGKAFSELSPRDQRKLKNSTLRAIQIKQLTPHGGAESVFHIFERLNTGGTQLKAQEIRSAVYRGPIVERLNELNSLESWQDSLGLAKPDRNQKDVEFVLRLFSMFESWEQYEKPMLKFLNSSMANNREFDSDRAVRFSERFRYASELVSEALEKPFRPAGIINSGVLEGVMVPLLEGQNITTQELKDRYPLLLRDEMFLDTISRRTTDTTVVRQRIRRGEEILIDAW